MQRQFTDSPFQRPLHLESSEGRDRVTGDVYALVHFPFEPASAALSAPDGWCDILILHMNTKACRVVGVNQATQLGLWIGKNQQ